MVTIQATSERRIGLTVWMIAFGAIVAYFAVTNLAAAQQSATEPPAVESPDPQSDPASAPSVTPAESSSATDTANATQVETPRDPKSLYDLWVILPAIIAILFAIFARQVVPALVLGIFVGAYMMVPCMPADSVYVQSNDVVNGFRIAAERYILGAITHQDDGGLYDHIMIMVFTLVIGFMVGVIGRNGGTAGLVRLVAGETDSQRRTGLTAWFAGLVVFFDDYANTMIVGPTMRSAFDRVKLSRAKLAYIVDSTAAPVASIAIIGTWIGAEIGFINKGIDAVTASGAPAFLLDPQGNVMSGMTAFYASLPHRFYPILALVLVFLIALTGRDFGPMKKAELKAQTGDEDRPYEGVTPFTKAQPEPRWWLGLIPVLVLVGATVAVLYVTGTAGGVASSGPDRTWWQTGAEILKQANPNLSIFYGAFLAAFAAVLLTLLARACSTSEAIDAGLEGMSRMFPAIVILILAWAISQVEQDLMLGQVAKAHLDAAKFPVVWLPLVVFVTAALISFATGTSWTTMGILCPLTVEIAARLLADMDPVVARELFYASVGSVLAGAIFGDHCSPISDTTVLSSIAAGCKHELHVWTQIPYAVVTAIVAMGVGDVACSVYGYPWYAGMGAGVVVLLLIVLIFGRRPMTPKRSRLITPEG